MNIVERKNQLRKEMYRVRAHNPKSFKKAYDLWICEQLKNEIIRRKAQVVHAYLPMGTEIDIRPLLSNLLTAKITVITPKTLPKRQLQNLELTSLDAVEKGVFGTSYPANSKEYTGTYDFVIVPGLAFDSQNFRLGYGGGYYDTFLAAHPTAFTTGIFYPFQQVPSVPTEEHDMPLDAILIRKEAS